MREREREKHVGGYGTGQQQVDKGNGTGVFRKVCSRKKIGLRKKAEMSRAGPIRRKTKKTKRTKSCGLAMERRKKRNGEKTNRQEIGLLSFGM